MQRLMPAAFVLFLAVPAVADEGWLGTHRPALSMSFTAGLTEEHNSFGAAVGTHVGLARFGPVRFPVLGASIGFAALCDPNGASVVPGTNDPCGNRTAGLIQVAGGAEFTFDRLFRSGGYTGPDYIIRELSLAVTPTYVVAGPLRGNWGVNIGIAIRWNDPFGDR
jgi:hypothetical protein